MLDLALTYIANNQSFLHLSTILGIFVITFARVLGKDMFFVIDDLDGIAKYSEVWAPEHEEEVKGVKYKIPEQKIDDYVIGEGSNRQRVKYLSFIPQLGFPGNILRFIRLHIGKKHQIIGKNSKGHDVWGYVQSPCRHHLFSMFVQAVNLVLGYLFLSRITSPEIAFAACLLYSVYPLTTQTVAWISGINYSLSMAFALAVLNSVVFFHDSRTLEFLVAFFSFISTITLYIGGFTFIPLLFLGYLKFAIISGVIGLLIVFWKGQETKSFRSKAFKEQNMGSTLSWNWRKPIVMVKTIWYYFSLVFLPLKMGLYHVWGYFYEEPIERINGMFWKGMAVIIGTILAFLHGNIAIRFGIVWFFSYFLLFSNFITAQQFVADRYVVVPAFGICLIIANFLHGSPLLWLLVGLYAMRTFMHLPTFRNEVDFYQSNFQNFRDSEVSLGNLGCAYVNNQMPGAAIDHWFLATKVNPHYDVAWYNLYSVFKGNNRMKEAFDFLRNALNAKVVHFEKQWSEEYKHFENFMRFQELMGAAQTFFNQKNDVAEKDVLNNLLMLENTPMNPGVPKQQFDQIRIRLGELNQPKPNI